MGLLEDLRARKNIIIPVLDNTQAGTTRGGNTTTTIKDYSTDERIVGARIKAELNSKTVLDFNGYGVGDGTEYRFFYDSLNTPRGGSPSLDFMNLISNPVYNKLPLYAIITSKIKPSILADFKSYYKISWYSEANPSTELDITTAIGVRLADIQRHATGLQVAMQDLQVAGQSIQVKDTTELLMSIGLMIFASVPALKTLGIAGLTVLGNNDKKDALEIAQKISDINRDGKLLQLEANQLLEIYNSSTQKPTDSTLNGIIGKSLVKADANLLDSLGLGDLQRSAGLSDNTVYLIGAAAIGTGIFLYQKGKQKGKRRK
jgi:hypothetical protein